MASHQKPRLSGGQSVVLLATLTFVAVRAMLDLILSLASHRYPGWDLKRIATIAYLRSSAILSYEQSRMLSLPTGDAIISFCRSSGAFHESEQVDCRDRAPPATLHFVKCRPRDTGLTLLYLHGGAYVNPLVGSGHTPFALACAGAAGARNVALLEYTLAPAEEYPGQLIQAVAAVEWLLRHHPPSDIVLGGDSAGANLVLALLAHIKKPSPYTPPISVFAAKNVRFRAAFLVSPWVRLGTASASYRVNGSRDYVMAHAVPQTLALWKPALEEVWANPVVCDDGFWATVPVERVLLTAGLWESILDDVREMATKMGAERLDSGSRVELALAEKEVHAQCIVDKIIGLPSGRMANDIFEWLSR